MSSKIIIFDILDNFKNLIFLMKNVTQKWTCSKFFFITPQHRVRSLKWHQTYRNWLWQFWNLKDVRNILCVKSVEKILVNKIRADFQCAVDSFLLPVKLHGGPKNWIFAFFAGFKRRFLDNSKVPRTSVKRFKWAPIWIYLSRLTNGGSHFESTFEHQKIQSLSEAQKP